MPQHMSWSFSVEELRTLELAPPFTFTKGCPLLRIDCPGRTFSFPDLLFDLAADPAQNAPLDDPGQKQRLTALLVHLMHENDAPREQFVRLGLEE